MSKTPKHNTYCFLNALALKYQRHPATINPLTVLADLYNFSPPQEQVLFLDRFCTAALTDAYAWEEGSPANAIDHGRQLELLVEVAWLLYKKDKKVYAPGNSSPASAAIAASGREGGKKKQHRVLPLVSELPMPLTAAAYQQPQLYLQQFFEHASLPKWKMMIAAFTVNAVSNESVANELPGAALLAFNSFLEKLVYAIYRLAVLKGVTLL